MKIGVDAHAAERNGTGNCTYIQNLLLHLGRHDKENKYFVYVTNPHHPFYEKLKAYKNFVIRPLRAKYPIFRIPFSLALRTWLDKVDILHVQYIAPPLHRGRLVVTIHDLAHFYLPGSFSKFEVLRSRLLIPLAVRKAGKILTGSRQAQNMILEKFEVSSDKVVVTPYGVSFELRRIEELLSPIELVKERPSACLPETRRIEKVRIRDKIQKEYGIDSPYILSLCRLNLRKNIHVLIEAFNLLKREKGIPHKLVIGGREDVRAKRIKWLASHSPFRDDIIFTGYIPDPDLPFLYGGADVFVFISEFEGFGLPVLEAMACGVAVITSATSSLPEVAGEAALYVENFTPREIAEKIATVLFDKSLQTSLAEKGIRRASLFSWEKTALLTLQAYKEVAGL